jgi:protein O-GlcNAc transferase
MLKVISFSLWGDNPKYTYGAVRNAQLALDVYPDWKCKFFIGKSVPKNIIDILYSCNNTLFAFKDSVEDWTGMFWRFETSYDDKIDVSIFRDTDSRLSHREKIAVDEWLNSDKTFHIMRDHPFHGYPILGGMWGYKNNSKYPMKELLTTFNVENKYGTDYEFFIRNLYPLIKDDKIVHDPFFDKIPFPTKRLNQEFVGEVYDENDTRNPDHYRLV